MKVVLLHPTGNRNVRAVISAVLGAGKLVEFDTTLAVDPQAPWLKLLPVRMRQEWLRRTFAVPSAQLWTRPLREMARMVLPRVGFRGAVAHERGWVCVDAVYQDFDRAVARRLGHLQEKHGADTVYAYEDGALATFTRAKALGMRCIYDLPIAYWETGRRLMLEEAVRLPRWAPTLGGGIQDSPAKLERKVRELELADVVVGPGKFVMDSLPAWARHKHVVMAPFGSPEGPAAAKPAAAKPAAARALRVLFVGSLGQRKGLGDLFAAVRLLNRPDLELVLLGTPLPPWSFTDRNSPVLLTRPAGRMTRCSR